MQRNQPPVNLVAAVVVAATAFDFPSANAQTLTPISQDRQVTVWAFASHCGGGAQSNDDSAEGLGPFDRLVQAEHGCALAGSGALAAQQSAILTASLTASGQARAESGAGIPNMMVGVGNSNFDVLFELEAESAFALTGELRASASGQLAHVVAQAKVILSGPGTIIQHSVTFGPDGTPTSEAIDEAGVLEPGVYRLRAFAQSTVNAPENPFTTTGEASFDFSIVFSAPCTGDLDGDAQVDLSDLAILLSNFGTPAGANPEDGDLDGDGDVDLTDLANLLSNFGSICS